MKEVIEILSEEIGTINEFHIWTTEHEKDHLDKTNAYIWLLKVYELKELVMLSLSQGRLYADVNEPVSLECIKTVLSDDEFNKIKNELLSK